MTYANIKTVVYATGLLLSLSPLSASAALFEDQAGLTDWYQQYVGVIYGMDIHDASGQLIVHSLDGTIAAYDEKKDEPVWRHVFVDSDSPAYKENITDVVTVDHQVCVAFDTHKNNVRVNKCVFVFVFVFVLFKSLYLCDIILIKIKRNPLSSNAI